MDYGMPAEEYQRLVQCNGHGDYGPHILSCQLCIDGIPHCHLPLTKKRFEARLMGILNEAIDGYLKR